MIVENNNDVCRITANLLSLLPLFQKKIIKPVEQVTKHTLSPLQHYVLVLLCEENRLTMTELAKALYISKSQLTPLIDKLIETGFLGREISEKDRRVIYIYLTTAGKNFLHQKDKEMFDLLKQKIETIPENQLSELYHALNVIDEVLMKLP
ncbi:MAG: MarR family transcriptional regulator [Clostridiales bacterium]|jgi:DNA-binding MarR family transcriptional regulator|nr:MarR family transcriptional regulator [Eubacteriales bacterium]MDH7566326.1 MarR family transcriptional regulator [Clostridiales bacterium]